MSETSGRQQSTRFRPGQSGNPRGRPKGRRDKLTILAERLMADDAEAVVAKVIELAKSGDMQAARVILDRILPPMKGRPIALKLPPINGTGDLVEAQSAVLEAVARGQITPDEAATLCSVLETKRRAIETEVLERRIEAIERQQQR